MPHKALLTQKERGKERTKERERENCFTFTLPTRHLMCAFPQIKSTSTATCIYKVLKNIDSILEAKKKTFSIFVDEKVKAAKESI